MVSLDKILKTHQRSFIKCIINFVDQKKHSVIGEQKSRWRLNESSVTVYLAFPELLLSPFNCMCLTTVHLSDLLQIHVQHIYKCTPDYTAT